MGALSGPMGEVPNMLPLVALLTLSGFHPQPGSFQAAPQAQKYADWKAIDDLAEAIRKDYKLPALAIAYQKIGEKPSAAVAGLRSSQNNSGPVEDDDRLLVCQIGQSMTATMIAHLIDEQKFGWNTTLAQALPEIPMLDVYKSITIEQLLRHKAELPQIDRFSQDQLKAMIAKAKNATALRKAYVTALLSMEPAPLAEGQTVSTNSEYVIVGYIAEAVIHQSFDSLMQRHVFNPMKMSTALISPVGSMGQVGGNNEVVPHVLGDFGYAPYVMPVTDIDSIMAPAGAGVSCSISDLLKFAVFHLKGIQGDAQILSPASYKRAIKRQSDGASNPRQAGRSPKRLPAPMEPSTPK